MSRWLFDLGNSRLKFAPLDDAGRIGRVQAVAHDARAFAPGWDDALPARIGEAHVASVAAPELRVALLDGLARRCGRIELAATQARWAGLRIAYTEPARLGVDRFLALLAAHARGGPWLVVGVGTALTVDLVDGDGRHHGGRIAPSPALMRQALHARAAQLPAAGGRYREFAAGTDDALESGCTGAALGLLARSQAGAQEACGAAVPLLLHGGGAGALLAHLPQAVHAPALVLEGLARWARPDASA
ncbi:type III pantothenate kinase [Luteimonas wenzhouensis]|jgi:type III pantothenate kinase|uniref:Type III pantothenate kinase n=1 Tax=Luteimonas wenzhouensis TaxID=2599615 RepID=A0A5C5U144_9GAMM|nr:type III pantothenate kinase [Luteimonas wenzhouensis]NLW96764.1 type III pantothenate kinase [Xanthomonadaceae bacterium]TWT19687.1 type III pantothenate kinase [Luteimonas wenzhouensis]